MLIEGPFESDYSLAIVNRHLAAALIRAGRPVELHQRDNTTAYPFSPEFLKTHPDFSPYVVASAAQSRAQIHSRYIYPPYTDGMIGAVHAIHCYGWEESVFPKRWVGAFNTGLDLITVMSEYVRSVLRDSGVNVPVEVVGLGADHIIADAAREVPVFEPDTFHFLHISSCFPRKGVDVLLEAYCREFRKSEPVGLIVKTFANPHNEVERIAANAFARHPNHSAVKLLWDSLDVSQMRYLIENANCLVAPSRGEGFGLPVAEAMLLGTPVIATFHGGHADLCSPEWCWNIDYRLQPARTHLTQSGSLWAEPDVDALAARMRELYESGREVVLPKTARAQQYIRSNFTWDRVAARHESACRDALDQKHTTQSEQRGSKIHIGFVSTWNARCGIAEYTRYLAQSLGSQYRFSVFASHTHNTVRPDEGYVSRCWTAGPSDLSVSAIEEMAAAIARSHCDIVSLQHNFSLLSIATVRALAARLKKHGIPVLMTLHGSVDQVSEQAFSALNEVDAIIVHRDAERDKLIAAGIDHAVCQPHGLPPLRSVERGNIPGETPGTFTVACFGFFLPPKGIYELLQAFTVASTANPALRLKLINALYDVPESRAYASECMRLIDENEIADRVFVCTEFLDDTTVLEELADADLVVLPYRWSTEASSAAIRLPLASLTPLLCSDLEVFREFSDIIHTYPADDTVTLANRMIELSSDLSRLRCFESKQRERVDAMSWDKAARQFEAIAAASAARRARAVV